MTRWQAVNQNGTREKGKKGLQWGIFLISLFPAQSGTQTTRAGGMAQLMPLLSALDCGERQQTARLHLGRRPLLHVLTAG